ncbi:MAG: cupin domain-containing protein [Clostridiales bacterium]|nr:cupin domain-containing protein [Clostridiales bacterium]
MMETNKDKIVLKTLEDAAHVYDDGHCSVRVYTLPYGAGQVNEVIDTVYCEKGYYIPYHYTDKGAETLLVMKGKVEVTLYGKVCECEAGDFINIPSHCPYSLRTLEEGVHVRGLYTGLDMAAKYKDFDLIGKNAFPQGQQADFLANEFGPAHGHFTLTEPVDTEKAGKADLPQITAKDYAIYEYSGWDGIRCELKVGRWNLKRVKEVWLFTLGDGCQLQYFKPSQNERVYSVKSGKVKVEVGGEALIAEAGDLIHIPQYTPFAITAADGEAAFYDLNVSTRLFRMLEMLELAQRDEPEKPLDPEWMKWLLGMNDSDLTGFVPGEAV